MQIPWSKIKYFLTAKDVILKRKALNIWLGNNHLLLIFSLLKEFIMRNTCKPECLLCGKKTRRRLLQRTA